MSNGWDRVSGGAIVRDPNDGLSVEVDVVDPAGSEARNVVRLGDQTIVGVVRERIPAKSGDSAYAQPRLAGFCFFDREDCRCF